MLTYGDMVDWSRLFDRLSNRLMICNQLLGCRYANCMDNPFRVCMESGAYVVSYTGSEIARFGVWDLDALKSALVVMENWEDCIWHMSRTGVLSVA